MAEDHDPKVASIVYERLKNRLLNNWFVATLVILAGVIVFSANLTEQILVLLGKFSKSPDIKLIPTVSANTGICGPVPVKEGEDVMFQRSTIDFSINNQTDRNQVVTLASLEPIKIRASLWGGESDVKEVYDVNLDHWYGFVIDAESAALEADFNGMEDESNESTAAEVKDDWSGWSPEPTIESEESENLQNEHETKIEETKRCYKPDPIELSEIVENKYEINSGDHERIQLKLGLSEAHHFLYGTVRLVIEMDSGVKLESDPLWITVCTVDQ